MRTTLVMLALLLVAPVVGKEPADWMASRPRSPEESLNCLEVRPGFRVELVACEPLVADPIAIAFGPEGKLWVVEMGGYPGQPVPAKGDQIGGQVGDEGINHKATGSAGGRIRVLEDSDGDGRFDSSTIFLDGLNFPTGVMPWRGGALITCAPEIIFARDTDGDGRADTRRVLFRGFIEGNPQHRVNGPTWGLDNWVHLANGDCGGMIESTSAQTGIDIHGHDFRVRPDEGWLELESGMSQFGRWRDDWGNWFGGNSAWPIWHSVLEDRYLRRNVSLAPPDPCVQLMYPPAHGPVFPISARQPRWNEPATESCFTSACGGTIYRDDLFGGDYANSFFVCEPAHNLVHHSKLHRFGASFTAERLNPDEESEFLASRDNWFRPTQVRLGPDGALWVVDMYRLVIEHPEYFLVDELANVDWERVNALLRAGSDRGRIYRVVPLAQPTRRWERLDSHDGPRLAEAIESPNAVLRDMAHQLLFERQDKTAQAILERIAARSQRPASRLQALCVLEGLSLLNTEVLLQALQDSHWAVRRRAIRLAETRLDQPEVLQALLEQTAHVDIAVRLQLAFSLGQRADERRIGESLAQLAIRDAADPMMVAAVLSSSSDYIEQVLSQVARHGGQSADHAALLAKLMKMALDDDQSAAVRAGLEQLGRKIDGVYRPWQFSVLAELLRGWEFDARTLKSLRDFGDDEMRRAVESLREIFAEARHASRDKLTSDALRSQAIRLLGRWIDGETEDAETATGLLSPQEPLEIQIAAATALGRMGRSDAPAALLENWRQHGPQLRSLILDMLLERREWASSLLDQLESKSIPVVDVDALHRDQLRLHYHASIRNRAMEVFGTLSGSRQDAVLRNQGALTTEGDARRGGMLFEKHCAVCHRASNQTLAAGPDLGALTDRSPQQLLVAILDPNRSVEPKYLSYTASTTDGRVLAGLLAQESGASITLVAPDGKQHVLLRRHVQQLSSSGKSMMPEGMEELLPTTQDLADVIAYVQGLQPNESGNSP